MRRYPQRSDKISMNILGIDKSAWNDDISPSGWIYVLLLLILQACNGLAILADSNFTNYDFIIVKKNQSHTVHATLSEQQVVIEKNFKRQETPYRSQIAYAMIVKTAADKSAWLGLGLLLNPRR